MKISATLALGQGARKAVEDNVLVQLSPVRVATAKLRISHAIAARFDDPAYSARVTERIAKIKATLAEHGEIEAWHVNAGAVPADEAEVLADPPAEDAPVDWSNAEQANAALDAGKLPDGFRMDGEVLVVPDEATLGKLKRGHSTIMARFSEIRNETGVTLKSRGA